MRPRSKNLWRNRDFLKFWSAQTTSVFGTQIASLAYPLTAILVLQASSVEMGILRATGSASAVLVGFFAGVIVDRVSRKPLLIFTDLGRAFLASLIPVAAFLGVLRIEHLFIISFFAGALNITSEVAAMAFLPSVVEKENLVEGNSKFAATDSVASIAGPGISGLLVQILTAPVAIIIDAVSFVFSAFFVWTIRSPEREKAVREERRSVWSEIVEGFAFVYKNPILRPLAESIALHFLFMLMISTIFTLYAIRELRLEPLLLGVIFSAFGFGFLFGALAVKRLTNRFGQGKIMVFGALLNAFASLLIPSASGSTAVFVLFAAHLLLAFGIQIHGINLMSLRQSITPNHLQGRMNGSFRFVNVCMMMFGALFAGLLGELIGLRATLFIGAIGMFLPFLRLFFSPVRNFTPPPVENL
ncbi:MAG TPA: MFS transporter [Pyrinomonadaceae bacterium]|nr:MFS transporter [Pyrinomonadaceae bacterium]